MQQPVINRRRMRRITLSLPVRLSPTMPHGEFFEDITKTINASREGFYFVTRRDHCQEGMRLFVTLPYHWRDRSDREHLAQVVRIELLDDGQHDVAVQLLPSVGRLQAVAPCYTGDRSLV
jgi:hypothetical protein